MIELVFWIGLTLWFSFLSTKFIKDEVRESRKKVSFRDYREEDSSNAMIVFCVTFMIASIIKAIIISIKMQ